jgi:hypothetical protein
MTDLCDDCGLPIAICIAKVMVEKAIARHGAEAVLRAIPAVQPAPAPTPADLLAHALRLPEVARMVEAERERCIMAFTNGRMDATYIDLHGIELEDLLAELRAGGAA